MGDRLHGPIIYYGGKGAMVGKLLPLIPAGGRPYVEPYCGGASVFFSRDPAPVEVLNDIDGDIVNLYRCLQKRSSFEELRHKLMYTPYARAEFIRALESRADACPVMRAWATFVRYNQGISGIARSPGNWSRTFNSGGGMSSKTSQWLMRLSMLDAFHWRLMRAQIDNRCALEVIRYWDTADAVMYCDPPYHRDTRKTKTAYTCEPDHAHYVSLVETLLSCRAAVVLSGYAHEVYRPLEEAGWERIDIATACYAAARTRNSGLRGKGAALAKVPRTETVWRNPRAMQLAPI